jgi:hypothetical protein
MNNKQLVGKTHVYHRGQRFLFASEDEDTNLILSVEIYGKDEVDAKSLCEECCYDAMRFHDSFKQVRTTVTNLTGWMNCSDCVEEFKDETSSDYKNAGDLSVFPTWQTSDWFLYQAFKVQITTLMKSHPNLDWTKFTN